MTLHHQGAEIEPTEKFRTENNKNNKKSTDQIAETSEKHEIYFFPSARSIAIHEPTSSKRHKRQRCACLEVHYGNDQLRSVHLLHTLDRIHIFLNTLIAWCIILFIDYGSGN